MAVNGMFPDTMLAYLGWPEMDHLRLVPAAAASITRLAAAFEAEFSRPLYLSDAYRTYAQQVSLKVTKGVFAATPGTSVHGLGLAIDMASRINVDGSVEHRWMEANGPAYGFINPAWAVDFNPYNGQHEPWHWEYKPALDTHPTLAQEDDMPLTPADLDAIQKRVNAALVSDIIRGTEFKAAVRAQASVAVTALIPALAAALDATIDDEALLALLREQQARNATTLVPALTAAVIAALPPAGPGGADPAALQTAAEAAIRRVLGSLD